MTESVHPGLQILPTPKKRASYRPAALRTNSNSRLTSLASTAGSSPASPQTPGLYRNDSKASRRSSVTSNEVTREHWTPDSSVSSCGACPTSFSFLERKHHCRRCGGIFCSAHSQYTVNLNPAAEFSPTGLSSRACPACRRDFELWMNPPNIRRPETASGGGTAMTRPQKMGRADALSQEESDEMRGLPAASVPSDWTWSTF